MEAGGTSVCIHMDVFIHTHAFIHIYIYIYVPVGIEVYMVLSDTPKQNKTATGKWYPAAQVIFMYSFSSGPNEFGFA